MLIDSASHDANPTIYHHSDGTFSLNQKNGPPISPADVLKYLRQYETFGTIRLVAHSGTHLQDWFLMLDAGGASGAPWYQFEIEGLAYRFHLPSMMEIEDSLTPEIINLTDIEYPSTKDSHPRPEVVIVADQLTTCREAIVAATPHTARGRSVAIAGEYLYLRHNKGEKFLGSDAFKRRRSEFWIQNIQPVIDRVRSVF